MGQSNWLIATQKKLDQWDTKTFKIQVLTIELKIKLIIRHLSAEPEKVPR
jgi:hypothetical protein